MTGSVSLPFAAAAPSAASSPAHRADIQVLRGWAVLLVVLHHAWLLPEDDAGYLGVDIFFVVSGFVITQLLLREIDSGRFRFREFFARRARRLLPAAYVTFIVTALLSPLFVLADEMTLFAHQVLGALTFTANLVLWGQTGYFAPGAMFKPLLHTWSLAVEEQFYFLWPLALAWVRPAWRLGLALAACATSLVLCLALNEQMPGAVFYLLPARGWELGLGCLGAVASRQHGPFAVPRPLWWFALATLALLPLHHWDVPQPGVVELAVCIATLVVLAGPAAATLPVAFAPATRLGDISYSLYLVHWPILSFASATYVSEMPVATRAALVALAFILAVALHRGVEEPLRRTAVTPRTTLGLAVAGASLIALATWGVTQFSLSRTPQASVDHRVSNVGLSPACAGGVRFEAQDACRVGAAPRVLLFGDSTAMHLADALRATDRGGFVQATKTLCGPLLDVSPYRKSGEYNREWAKGCLSFQASVLDWLASQRSIEVVVLATAGSQYLVEDVAWAGGVAARATGDRAAVGADRLAAMVRRLHQMGKRVIIVQPPPSIAGIDVGRCLALRNTGKAAFGADSADCSLSRERADAQNAAMRRMLDDAAAAGGVPVVRLSDALCNAQRCRVEADGIPLYNDGSHLSRAGSAWLGRHLDFYSLVASQAR